MVEQPAIDITRVVKRFGDVVAVDSTPDEGSVAVLGGSPRTAIRQGRVSAVLQSGGLLKDLTVAETVRMLATLYPKTEPAASVLERAGITRIADYKVGKCSGGEQQRLRFALALLPDPELILLDEPTAGMDVEGRQDFWSAIHDDANRGSTVVFATHYLEEADAYADRIVLISDGSIVADGTTAEIKNLASGRTVTVALAHADLGQLRRVAGVESAEQRGNKVIVHTSDSDLVARYLLNETQASDIQITSNSLEDAFVKLTRSDR